MMKKSATESEVSEWEEMKKRNSALHRISIGQITSQWASDANPLLYQDYAMPCHNFIHIVDYLLPILHPFIGRKSRGSSLYA